MADTAVTWLGHRAFRIDTPGGKRVYVDPWLSGTRSARRASSRAGAGRPDRAHARARRPLRRDLRAGEALRVPRSSRCVEVRDWLAIRGLPEDDAQAGEQGRDARGRRRQGHARRRPKHSSSIFHDGSIVATSASRRGSSIEVENGTKLYFAGDTCVFGDMQPHRPPLRARRRRPADRRPLHDGSDARPRSRSSSSARTRCIPCHYGTFAAARRDARAVREQLTTDCEILAPEPGGTVTVCMRQRWFGATGRRVPEIAVEGEDDIPLDDALVLDDVADEVRLREAHASRDAGRRTGRRRRSR